MDKIEISYYRFRNKRYMFIPKGYRVGKTELDEQGLRVGVLKKKRLKVTALLTAVVILTSLALVWGSDRDIQVVEIPTEVYYSNSLLHVNINNNSSNKLPIVCKILYDGDVLYNTGELQPGESIGTISYPIGLEYGEYKCKLRYGFKYIPFYKTYNVSLIVGEEEEIVGGM